MASPRVSVLVLNFNGRDHLERCLGSLMEQDYPDECLEVVLIDNDSTDDSLELVRGRFPDVRLITNSENLGYAAAINRGVEAVDSPVVALLNNDARADRSWLSRLVPALERPKVAAVASKVYSWDGKTIDYAGGGTNFHACAFQVGQGENDREEFNRPGPTLFACGAAMAVDRETYLDLGGLDEDYFAYYEDVDFGWRSWVAGFEVHYEPTACVYHHHSATSVKIPIHKLRVLHIRNPLFTLFKNYEEENLMRVLPASLLVSLKRTWYLSQLDAAPFRIGPHEHHRDPASGKRGLFRGRGGEETDQPMPKVALSDLVAYNDLLDGWGEMVEKRRRIQERRARSDDEILSMFHRPFWAVEPHPTYEPLFEGITEFFGLSGLFPGGSDPASGRDS